MKTGLTFDEYVDLTVKTHKGASDVFLEAAEDSAVVEMFPMTLAGVSSHLRSRGYDCRPEMLEMLVENGVVTPPQADQWTLADVDAAADHFEDCDMFTPYAAMCQTLGCRYADFIRPLREAAERESVRWGRRIPADDQYFVMHREPPRGGDNARPAIITFTLCDDIRERIERGEEV
jgi:hypothetical protein